MTASLLKSSGFLSVFWLSSIMLSFGWSLLVRQLPNSPGPLIIVPKVQIKIVTFMFHFFFFFQFSSKVEVLIPLFTFFQFYSVVSRNSKVDKFASFRLLLLLLFIIRSGLLAEIRWSVCMSMSIRSLCVLLSRNRYWVVHIPFVRMVKFKFLAHFPVDHLAHPVVSHLILLLI